MISLLLPGVKQSAYATLSTGSAAAGCNACMASLAEKVVSLRVARRLTQAGLAKLLGVSQSAISQIERGRTVSLSGEVLAGLCQHLHVTPQFLLGDAAPGSPDADMLEAEALFMFRSMTQDRRRSALLMLRGLANAPATPAAPAPPARCHSAKH
jgi:transcriptional regulator with XRE-family HTH domain